METTDAAAPLQWRLLQEGFGREVAEAYRDGLKLQWRSQRPARPRRKPNGWITTKKPNILAFGAISSEAAEDPEWTARLSDDEAHRAALHGCLTEQGYPEWIDALVESHPRVTLPLLRRAIRDEFVAPPSGRVDFLHRFARVTGTIKPVVQKMLFALVCSREPTDLHKFASMIDIVERLDLSPQQRRKLFKITEERFAKHKTAENQTAARYLLALFLLLDFNLGLAHLESWLGDVRPDIAKEHAEQTFAFLFDRHHPLIPTALAGAAVGDLERLLRLVYSHIRPEADIPHEGSYTPDTRDHAEGARNIILSAVLDRPGPDSFYALRRMSGDPVFSSRAIRFRELSRGKAERDAEPPAWTPTEVLAFERERTAPAKTGADLLRIVLSVLKDIQFALHKEDASSRKLLQRAENEDEVQNWLAEQLMLRAKGRYRAFREAEVALRDKPDVIVASASAPCEVAIEVKHSKNWTARQLDNALRTQLAEDYLKPEPRRHGVFVITHHAARQWRDIETNELMTSRNSSSA